MRQSQHIDETSKTDKLGLKQVQNLTNNGSSILLSRHLHMCGFKVRYFDSTIYSETFFFTI